jgi:hypothetical protein
MKYDMIIINIEFYDRKETWPVYNLLILNFCGGIDENHEDSLSE